MKNTALLFITALLCACTSQEEETTPETPAYDIKPQWVTYEGFYPDGKGGRIVVELSLEQGAIGTENQYTLNFYNKDCDCKHYQGQARGQYTTMYGSSPRDAVITVGGTRSMLVVAAEDKSTVSKLIVNSPAEEFEMRFRNTGNDALVALDEDLQPITDKETQFILHRRSRLFTVEGYLTYLKDTAEFYEMNTNENWAVAKEGRYQFGKRRYFETATEKFEGIYVKGLGYSIAYTKADGNEAEALVFRDFFEIKPGGKSKSSR